MADTYFGISADGTLANLVNVETLTGSLSPMILPDLLIPFVGKVKSRSSGGVARADGFIDGFLAFDLMRWSDYRTLMFAVHGGFAVSSKAVALTLLSEDNRYSPFTGYIEKATYTVVNEYWIRDIRFPLSALVLQSSTKTSNFTPTTSTRLLYADTTSGSITFALPAVSGVTVDTIFSFEKTSAANSMILDPNAAELISGASTYTVTANRSRVDIYSDGSAWQVV